MVPFGTTVFKTVAIVHSANPPRCFHAISGACYSIISDGRVFFRRNGIHNGFIYKYLRTLVERQGYGV